MSDEEQETEEQPEEEVEAEAEAEDEANENDGGGDEDGDSKPSGGGGDGGGLDFQRKSLDHSALTAPKQKKWCSNCLCQADLYFTVTMHGNSMTKQIVDGFCRTCNMKVLSMAGNVEFDKLGRPIGGVDKNKPKDEGSSDDEDDEDGGDDDGGDESS